MRLRMRVPADPAERNHERERGRESAIHRISKEEGLAYERGEHDEGDSHGRRVGRRVSTPPGNRSPDEAGDRHARRERQERVQPPVAGREEREAPRHEKKRQENEVGPARASGTISSLVPAARPATTPVAIDPARDSEASASSSAHHAPMVPASAATLYGPTLERRDEEDRENEVRQERPEETRPVGRSRALRHQLS